MLTDPFPPFSVTRSHADKNSESSDYLITVPKVLTNEQDKICLVWLNEQTRPSEKFDVKVKEIGSETVLQQLSAPLSSGKLPPLLIRFVQQKEVAISNTLFIL